MTPPNPPPRWYDRRFWLSYILLLGQLTFAGLLIWSALNGRVLPMIFAAAVMWAITFCINTLPEPPK